MSQAYSAGLAVTDSIVLKKERILPLKGKVLVNKGDKVKSDDLVAETSLPGNILPMNVANKLGITPAQVNQFIKIKAGEQIKKGQIIAEDNGFLGLGFFKSSIKSPIEGEVESVSTLTGQVMLREPRIPVQIKAFIDGIVVEVKPEEGVVIENKSAYIQGIFGICGETNGLIKILVKDPSETLKPELITAECKDKLIVGGSLTPIESILKAKEMGVRGIITGGIDDQDIKKLLGYDIGVAITGHENLGITVLVTEGFGPIKMAEKTFNLLKSFEGKQASMHGKTQIRAGVIRPEVIIPLDFEQKDLAYQKPKLPILEPGQLVRIIRQPGFGEIGKITALPEALKNVESETNVRILEAEVNGQKLVIPRANVELIEQ
ncbi:MAG: hypothetical protein PHY08_04350 [Candidatus Cloacimonetes bacterium]|jgi:hypothetical protein|nr:hypothetical protein [Candidatus Cloacimonadota bacterium]MDD4155785.1 hypothetical protein [Candidatus Cloacimonadota bacterium]